MYKAKAPVKENEVRDVEIQALGSKGDGIAKVDKFTIFVPATKIGDKVRVRIGKVLPKFAFAEVTPSDAD